MERYRPSNANMTSGNQPEKKIRGRPFPPGNPGRPRGSKNRTTRVIEQLLEGQAEAIARKFVERALAGDQLCLRVWLDRFLPRRSGRVLDFDLPRVETVEDLVPAMAAVSSAVSAGLITPEEAGHLVHFFEVYGQALEARDIVSRLDAVEARLEKSK